MAILMLDTDFELLQAMLNRDLPDGMTFVSTSPAFVKRSLDIEFTVSSPVQIIIHVNLTAIAALTAASWLVREIVRIRATYGKFRVDLDGRELPPNETDAVKLIAEKIETQENDE